MQITLEKAYQLLQLKVTYKFDIDENELYNAYMKIIKLHHPDKFLYSNKWVKNNLIKMVSIVNDAYHLLKSPVHRAGLILSSLGHLDKSSGFSNKNSVFAFELYEKIEALSNDRESKKSALADLYRCFDKNLQNLKNSFKKQAFIEAVENYHKIVIIDKIIFELKKNIVS